MKHKVTRSISSPPVWNASPLQVYSSSVKFSGTHLYTRAERGTPRVKCLAQEHTQCPWLGLEPRNDLTNHEATMPPKVFTDNLDIVQNIDARVLFIENLSAQLF